jgi:hypothetical protein
MITNEQRVSSRCGAEKNHWIRETKQAGSRCRMNATARFNRILISFF